MPDADNLHNQGNDSRNSWDEENSDELSPTDGYFNSNQIPQNMIPDLTHSQEDIPKAREASEESAKDTDISSTLQMSSHTNASAHATENSRAPFDSLLASSYRRRDNTFSEHQSLFDQPPPAYVASAESCGVSAQGQHTPTNYNTFSQSRLEEGRHGEPQNMGGPVGNPEMNERTPLWLLRTPKRLSFRREIIKKVLGVGIVIAIIATILSTNFISSDSHPNMGGGPKTSNPIHDGGSYCPHASNSDQTTFEIPHGAGLIVRQEFYQQDRPHYGREVQTAGEVRIRHLPRNSKKEKAYFTIDAKLSHPELSVLKTLNEDDGSLKVSTPRFAHLNTNENPCISLEITAWIPEDLKITNVFFDLVTLSIQVFDDAKIEVVKDTQLKTVSGHIKFPKYTSSSTDVPSINAAEAQPQAYFEFDSRRIVVETVSGKIEGSYPLYDLLNLSSHSGAIEINVSPKPVLESAPAPATLDINTSSGRIKVSSPIKLPEATYPREYITRLGSVSGTIRGDFFVGSTGTFKTTSSSIQLVVRPVLPATSDDDKTRNEFSTHSISGTTHVTLLDPLLILPPTIGNIHDGPLDSTPVDNYFTYAPGIITLSTSSSIQPFKSQLRTFYSTHRTTSGHIESYYPSSWVGNIKAKTISGRIKVEGKGIEIMESNDGWGHKWIKARKGVERENDGNSVGFETVSGAIALKVIEGL
ncbi:bf842521-8249-4920-9fac-3f9e8cb5f855 [Sclerotinia trifoliorum]|uniref:Bf842521-8249-4920-9fac-3f9e8cb5f855 n=1 Tax=Sclerotinia trifoliorum TaxID=28548 RepID=A0A8H2VRA8_9HELO|nr:bf842521-8249-4920-9fac-3f9e8cb5f855 [Sclerotinia trifoliorum]